MINQPLCHEVDQAVAMDRDRLAMRLEMWRKRMLSKVYPDLRRIWHLRQYCLRDGV
jgi:hypothetical protein